jgi:bla regulator protein blaR1
MREKSGELLVGSRNTTMPLLAQAIYPFGTMAGEVDKPVVDRTGLNGRFDFTIEYSRGENALVVRSAPPDAGVPPTNPQGAPFLSARREQLGLKLTPSKGPIRMLIIDHIDALSEN